MIGETISHFRILEKLGEGGMGIVYKAHDSKLDREVALKFLPDRISASPDDLLRFTQEAKAAAALNHPNICTIHGIEESEGRNFIVMEYVDGQMLEEKKHSLTQKQAVEIGIQIAEGLAAAHEKGIVHRDIKPENIMIRKDGRVQVMDFGLAKLRGASRLTKEGSTVGTAGYMSPEQVQGQETDHRSDIFSLGVLLYEMLTGQAPFKGVHETAITYEIVNVDATPMSSIKPDISPELDAIVLECMEKEKDERYQSAKEVAKDLRRVKRPSTGNRASRAYRTQSLAVGKEKKKDSGILDVNFKRRLAENKISLFIIAFLVVALFTAGYVLLNSPSIPSGMPTHLSMNIEEGLALGPFSSFEISPDGSKIVYAVNQINARMLYLRDITSYEARTIPGTEGALSPCFSPDGKWLAFWSNEIIKKVFVTGGPVTEVFKFNVGTHPLPYLFWGADNRIYFSQGIAGGIYRVPADGGLPEIIAETDSNKGQLSYRWPVLLPGGSNLMFAAESESENTGSRIDIRSLRDGTTKTIVDHADYAKYMKPGYLLFVRDNSLFASRFDLGSLALEGAPVPVLTHVTTISQTGQAQFCLSDNGTLLYLPGTTLSDERNLAWVDRSGRILKSTDLHQPIEDFDISPDGKKVAVTIEGSSWNISIYDIERNMLSRLTYGADSRDPLWTPDGKSMVFDSFRDGSYGLYLYTVDNPENERTLVRSKYFLAPFSISHDGRYLAYTEADSLGKQQLTVKTLNDNAPPRALSRAPVFQDIPVFSPDGKYMAYTSEESGKREVYVIPFNGPGNKVQISVHGGDSPFWSRDGNYLYFIQGRELIEVPVNGSPGFTAGSPRGLFSNAFRDNTIRPFEEIPGTRDFMMLKSEQSGNMSKSLNVILNWKSELKNKVSNVQ